MKSKIEEKIEKAREATNEMFAAFEELNERLSEKEPKFKDGDIIYQAETDLRYETLRIYKNDSQTYALYLFHNGYLSMKTETNFTDSDARVATPEEIALLDSKLAEQGKRFDKEKLELVDIPKHKEPIIGELAIGWSGVKARAIVGILNKKDISSMPYFISVNWFENAILFESPEQYKAFLKS